VQETVLVALLAIVLEIRWAKQLGHEPVLVSAVVLVSVQEIKWAAPWVTVLERVKVLWLAPLLVIQWVASLECELVKY
jgi:hypothetical protein